MKRGTPAHPKTIHLCAILDVPRYVAVGLLECLWHFAQSYAQRGDIGRHTDEAVAGALGWTGDPHALMAALWKARWLDACRCHRFRIHDWPDHADQSVSRSQVVQKQGGFLKCYADPSSALVPDETAVAVAVPLPEPLPPPEPEPLPEPVNGRSGSGALANQSNPIGPERGVLEAEALTLVREIAADNGRDPTEVMAEATTHNGRRGSMNPAAMTYPRLLNTVLDLRKMRSGERPLSPLTEANVKALGLTRGTR